MPCGRVHCDHCGKWNALVRMQMVMNACEVHGNPQLICTVTSKDPDRDVGERWRRDMEALTRGIRRRCPDAKLVTLNEWTSGLAARSGGRRRPHGHSLVWGASPEDAPALQAVGRRIWGGRTGSPVVEVAALRAHERGIAYVAGIAGHHSKARQAPPSDYTGRTLRASKGVWLPDGRTARELARAELRDRAVAAKLSAQLASERALIEDQGVPPDVAAEYVDGIALMLRAKVDQGRAEVLRVTASDEHGHPTGVKELTR